MPLDALCLAAVREELSHQLIGKKIDKIQQPERDMILLTLRGTGTPSDRLLISTGSGDARVHLTAHQFENPAAPPMFCMLLRKHLSGARLKEITQLPAERVLVLTFSAVDAIGIASEKKLIIELIGRMPNVILTGEDGIIIECMRRIGGDLSEKRVVLPGLLYRNPQIQEHKRNPLLISQGEFIELFDELLVSGANAGTVDSWLLSRFAGLSPLICREIAWRAYGCVDYRIEAIADGGEMLKREFFMIADAVKDSMYEAWVLVDPLGNLKDFSYICIKQYENALQVRKEECFSVMLDGYYTRSAQAVRVKQRASATRKTVTAARDRLVRKLALQHAELKKTDEREFLRECGDIIMANLHMMKKGQDELLAHDFYSADNSERRIALDPRKMPQENAAKYYKDYTRAKTAKKHLSEQIARGERELVYIDSVLGEIEYADGEADIQDIRRELTIAGYLKAGPASKTKAKPVESMPMKFVSSSGMQIIAGRNNMQNDKLTLKTAFKNDMWLHTQKIHGSHVIIKCSGAETRVYGAAMDDKVSAETSQAETAADNTAPDGSKKSEAVQTEAEQIEKGSDRAVPDETTLYEAAVIAAYYSSAREAGKVPVDYTHVRHVRKPSGGRPGMVIYKDFKTLIVAPDEKLVRKLSCN